MNCQLQFPTSQTKGESSGKTRPMIYGRMHDLKRLRGMYEDMTKPQGGLGECSESSVGCSGSDGRVVFISGLAGVGKSALVQEFINVIQIQSDRLTRRRENTRDIAIPFMHASLTFTEEREFIVKAPASMLLERILNYESPLPQQDQAERKEGAEKSGKTTQAAMKDSIDESAANSTSSRGDVALAESLQDVANQAGKAGSNELAGLFLEFHHELEHIALKVSREVTEKRNTVTRTKSKRYQNSSSEDSSSSDSDDESVDHEELFESSQQERASDTQRELDDILLANKSKSRDSLYGLMKYICKYVTRPFLVFFDNLNLDQLDQRSQDVLSFLLSSPLPNSMIICASRHHIGSSQDSPKQKLMQINHAATRLVDTMTVNPLSLEVVTMFIADSIKKEKHEASIVARDIYNKTMGIASYVRKGLKEAIDKKVLHYDFESEDWRWEITKVDLVTDFLSLDSSVIEYVTSRLNDAPNIIRRMMTLMSCLSDDIHFQGSLLADVMDVGGSQLDEKAINDCLDWAANEGLLTVSSNSNQSFQFAHPIIRCACQQFMSEKERQEFNISVFSSRFVKWNELRPNGKWSKKEISFLIEFLNLLDVSPESRTMGSRGRNRGKMSKSMGPSVSPLSKDDGKDVRLSDCPVAAAPVEQKRNRGGRRKGTAAALSKSLGCMSDLKNMEISVPEQIEEAEVPSKSTMIQLLSEKITTLPVKPLNTTKQVTDYLFFPHVTDPKSWLLKHGSVFVGCNDGSVPNSIDKERDLLLLTHGFCLIDVSLKDVFRLFFALSDQEYLTETTFMNYVRTKLNLNQEDYIDKEKIYQCFYDLNVPKPKNLVSVLLEKGDVLNPKEFQESLQGFLANKRLPNSIWEGSDNTKVEMAKLFSSVARVDSLSISHSDGSLEMYTSDQADFSLSITLFEDTDGPLYFTFASSESRESWLNEIGDRVISAWEDSSDAQLLKMQTKLGWQHMVVRSSPTTFVILNDHKGLEKCLNKTHVDLNVLDRFNGYSALHYATILNQPRCVEVLLRHGAAAMLHDKNGLLPMIHAIALGHDEVSDLIEAYGSKKKDAIKSVDEDDELRNAAIKATSESLRSLEMSDTKITPLPTDLCWSCPPSLGYSPVVSPRDKSEILNSPLSSGPSPLHKDPVSVQNNAPPILRSGHQRAQTIPRSTSLEDFKTSTPAARRVSWADVFGQPSSLQTIVTYELSESDDEDNSVNSVDITDTSTTQATILSDEDDNDKGEISPADQDQLLPEESQRLNKVAASIGRSHLGRSKLQTIQSNNSIVISEQSDDDGLDAGLRSTEVSSFPHVNSICTRKSDNADASSCSPLDSINATRNFHQKNSMFKSIGQKFSSQPKPKPTAGSNEPGVSALLNINPKLLVPTRLNNKSQTTSAASLGRQLLGRPRRTTS